MNERKIKAVLWGCAICVAVLLCAGCSAAPSRSKEDVNDLNNIADNKIADSGTSEASSGKDLGIIDKLPPEQKDAELDAKLAKIRKSNKEGTSRGPDGSILAFTQNGDSMPGQSKNIPDWSKESDAQSLQRENTILDYLKNTLKLPEGENYNTWTCIDPRMNAIYDDPDKGVAKGYENQNIYITEYETATPDVYSYLILVRDSPEADWKVIHRGNSYKV